MFYPSGLPAQVSANHAESEAISARADAREAKTETEFMRHDIDRLLLITQALWTLLKKEHGYSDEDLAKVVTEIDMQDGRLDGRVSGPTTVVCPACGRNNQATRPMCIYCGKPLPVALFAR